MVAECTERSVDILRDANEATGGDGARVGCRTAD